MIRLGYNIIKSSKFISASAVWSREPSRWASGQTASAETATTEVASSADDDVKEAREPKGWFRKINFPKGKRRSDSGQKSYSASLTSKTDVYEIQFHHVKPEYMEEYLGEFESFLKLLEGRGYPGEMLGSWTVEVGKQDEAIHLWRYTGGYNALNEARSAYITDDATTDYRKKRNKMLLSRRNDILLPFSYWPDVKHRSPTHIYELRTYQLKPGAMLEFANSWAKHIQIRLRDDVGVGGFLTNVGEIYKVYHIWAYNDLNHRKQCRDQTWNRPGWHENVANTVPCIERTTSEIMIPTPFSKLQ